MSYVIAEPELLQGAAEDLAGIRASLAGAAATVAGPTTGIAAAAQDEISIAIASMFGDFGQEFQAVNAQAHAFHEQFVTLMNAGAGAYAGAETTNVERILLGDAAAGLGRAQAELQSVTGNFGATVAGPYQTLISDTAANLQTLQSAIVANPAPLLNQFLNNQVGYGQAITSALGSAIQNFPAQLANAPAAIQALLTADPAAVVQGLVNQQMGYGQTIATALGTAAQDFSAGAVALPGSLQAGFQQLMAGNVAGAGQDIATGFGNLFLTGLNANQDMTTFLISITPTGTLGDLLPIVAIPGQMAQNFTDLLPAASVPGQISQHLTNVIKTVTDTTQTLDLNTGDLHVGLPLVLGLEAIGPAFTTANAFGSSASAFVNALQTGDGFGAAVALVDAPAVVLNGFLNGQATLGLPVSLGELNTTTNIPLGGILAPAQFTSLTFEVFGTTGTIPLSGTAFGGIVPGLLTFLPEQLAQAIGAAP